MLNPPVLASSWIRLRLLTLDDAGALLEQASDPDVWKWFTVDFGDQERMNTWIKKY